MTSFADFKELGVAPKHLAKLLNINRVTASNWINGHSAPHHILDKKAAKLLGAVKEAKDEGALPPPTGFKGLERDLYVVRVLASKLATKPRP